MNQRTNLTKGSDVVSCRDDPRVRWKKGDFKKSLKVRSFVHSVDCTLVDFDIHSFFEKAGVPFELIRISGDISST